MLRIAFGARRRSRAARPRGARSRGASSRGSRSSRRRWMAIPFSCFSLAEQWINSSLAGMLNGAMPLDDGDDRGGAAAARTRSRAGRRARDRVRGRRRGDVAGARATDRRRASPACCSCCSALLCYGFAANVSVPLQQEYGTLPVVLPRPAARARDDRAVRHRRDLGHSAFAWGSTRGGRRRSVRSAPAWRSSRWARCSSASAPRAASVAIYFVPDRRRDRRRRVPRRAHRRALARSAWCSSSSARCSRAGRIGGRPPCPQD